MGTGLASGLLFEATRLPAGEETDLLKFSLSCEGEEASALFLESLGDCFGDSDAFLAWSGDFGVSVFRATLGDCFGDSAAFLGWSGDFGDSLFVFLVCSGDFGGVSDFRCCCGDCGGVCLAFLL